MKYNLSVKEFLEKRKNGEIDYNDFYSTFLTNLKRKNKELRALRVISHSQKGDLNKGKLYGLPISVKDNICVKGVESCAGSKILEGYIPPFDASCISNVKKNSGAIIGKTNQDEFGFGTFSTNSGFDIPLNPLDKTRVAGGSSGGSAAIVAGLDMPHVSLGESTGGSISCPSAFCSVVGLTPTYGLVSRYGLIDYANSLDKIGVIGKTVYDTALLLSIIAGHDEKDFTTINKKAEDYTNYCSPDVPKKIKLGVPKEYFSDDIDKRIRDEVWNSIHYLESIGIDYEECSLKMTRYALPAYYIIAMAESSTNLAKFCGLRYGLQADPTENFNNYFSKIRSKGFGEEAKRRIILGTFARMSGFRDAYYLRAMKVRTLVIDEYKRLFKKYYALISPTMPIFPPKIKDVKKISPIQCYMSDILTVPPNLAGMPMISVPSSVPSVGIHIVADHLQEGRIIKIAYLLENRC